MTLHQIWKDFFTNWPEGIHHRGILINSLNEAMPFKGFMIRGDTVVLERTNPDPLGARYILIGFESVNCVKFVDVLQESTFAKAGFAGKLSQQ